ncbi:MAG: hypothetical protein GVY13_09745 [Alphaproteobacteria bacterium]|nr:hypothetical protein [Alphaproteobacteria bacterium]
MSIGKNGPADCAGRTIGAGPEATLAIVFEARRLRRRVLRDLVVRLFWSPGRLAAGLGQHVGRHASAGPGVGCS